MINLNSISYDTSQWEMLNTKHCQLRNLKTNKVYPLYEYLCYDVINIRTCLTIAGIHQISYNEFLVHCILANTLHYICKFCLEDDAFVIFVAYCKRFTILSEKTVLLDNVLVIDVEENKSIKAFDWLKYQDLVVLQKPNYNNLIVQIKFPVSQTEYISAYVDAISFEIIKNKVFSTLRDQYISLEDQTIQDIVQEDKVYLAKIDSFFAMKNASSLEAFEQEIFG